MLGRDLLDVSEGEAGDSHANRGQRRTSPSPIRSGGYGGGQPASNSPYSTQTATAAQYNADGRYPSHPPPPPPPAQPLFYDEVGFHADPVVISPSLLGQQPSPQQPQQQATRHDPPLSAPSGAVGSAGGISSSSSGAPRPVLDASAMPPRVPLSVPLEPAAATSPTAAPGPAEVGETPLGRSAVVSASAGTSTHAKQQRSLVFADSARYRTREDMEDLYSEAEASAHVRRGSRGSVAGSGAGGGGSHHVTISSLGPGAVLPNGKVHVRVTRDGKTTVEEMDPLELGRLHAQKQAALQQLQRKFDFLSVPDWVRLHPMLGPYLAEATGTFAWVLTLSLASIRNQSIFNTADDTNVTCLPIGFMFTTMVFTFAYISGGHFNPAITLAVFLIRKLDLIQCLGYMVCQVGAAFVAGVTAMLIQGNARIFVPSVENSFVSSGIFSEMIFTFAVALVVLNTGYSRQSGNFFYGFAIGMTIAAGSASVGRISGGAFNPAAATGLQLAKCMAGSCDDLKSFWIYWLAPLIGAIIASLLYSQMYQPTHTQVLEDHKVLRDPAKRLMEAGGAREEDGDGDGGQSASSSVEENSVSDSTAHSGADDDGEGGEEMRTRVGSHTTRAHGVLNDSLSESPVVVRGGRAQGDRKDVAGLV